MKQHEKDEIIATLERGHGIATAQDIEGLASIHDIPNAEHLAFGFFQASVNGYHVDFCAGGAMTRTKDFSWTAVITPPKGLLALGIDIQKQLEVVKNIKVEEK